MPTLFDMYPGIRGDGARGVRHVRHRVHRSPRPHPHPHARRLGRHPLRKDYEVGRIPVQFKGSAPNSMSILDTIEQIGERTRAGIEAALRARRSRAAARGRCRPAHERSRRGQARRPTSRSLRGSDHDHQHGSAAPEHARCVAPHARAPQGETGAAVQAGDRLPPHRHGEDGRAAHLSPGRHQRHAHGLPEPVVEQRARVLDGRRDSSSASRTTSPSAPCGSACSSASSTGCAATCCSWPPTAWTSVPCR